MVYYNFICICISLWCLCYDTVVCECKGHLAPTIPMGCSRETPWQERKQREREVCIYNTQTNTKTTVSLFSFIVQRMTAMLHSNAQETERRHRQRMSETCSTGEDYPAQLLIGNNSNKNKSLCKQNTHLWKHLNNTGAVFIFKLMFERCREHSRVEKFHFRFLLKLLQLSQFALHKTRFTETARTRTSIRLCS